MKIRIEFYQVYDDGFQQTAQQTNKQKKRQVKDTVQTVPLPCGSTNTSNE